MSQAKFAKAPSAVDPIWHAVRQEAQDIVDSDSALATFIHSTILNQRNLENAVSARIADRLHSREVPDDIIRQAFEAMAESWPEWADILRIDIGAVL